MQPAKQNINALFKISNIWKTANGGECIHSQLGNIVDLQWNVKEGVMKIQKSQQDKTSYQKNQQHGVEILKGIQFRHGATCPLENKNITLNKEKIMKPCASVMLLNRKNNQFLATKRSKQLRTFPSAWVLPGGHLDPGEGLFDGGIRQCEQQVGFQRKQNNFSILTNKNIMLWESVFVQQGHVKGCALCLFFMVECDQFQVKVEPRQVEQYKWKNIMNQADETRYNSVTKSGYAEGHLKYLSLIRKNNGEQNSRL